MSKKHCLLSLLMNGDQLSTTKMLVLPSINVFILCPYQHRLKSSQVFGFSLKSVTDLLICPKALFCVGGHHQLLGKDYFQNKNYCSVLSSRDNHNLLALGASEGWQVYQTDIVQAFLCSEIKMHVFWFTAPMCQLIWIFINKQASSTGVLHI